ncbi:MAG: hypothetical protein M1548_10305 [Actinobacteria bacterium]|nr:hypothetical protein [Actinomycetota bacterium]
MAIKWRSADFASLFKREKLASLFKKDSWASLLKRENLAPLFKGRRGYVTFLVIAAVITVLTVIFVSKMVQLRREENLYQQGRKALEEKNYEGAVEDFSKLFKENPKYKDVQVKLGEAINAAAAAKFAGNPGSKSSGGSSGGPGGSNNGSSGGGSVSNTGGSSSGGSGGGSGGSSGGSTGGGTGGSGGGSGGSQAANPVDLLPKSLTGYETMGTQTGPNFANRGFIPQAKEKVFNALVTVHDRATPEGAQAFVEGVSKKAFSFGGKSMDVKGKPGYFGTDGRVNATLVWMDGKIVYEMLMMSSRNQPAELEDTLVWAATQF